MEKRPLFIIFLSLISGALIFETVRSNQVLGMLLILPLFVLMVLLILKKRYRILLIILVPLSFSFFTFFALESKANNLINDIEVALTGRIISIKGNVILLDKVKIYIGDKKWKRMSTKVNVILKNYRHREIEFSNLGSWIFAEGTLKRNDRYPFFNLYVDSAHSRNYSFAPYFDSFSTVILYKIGRIRKGYEEFLKENSSSYDLIAAVMFGNSPESKNRRLLLNSGLYHLFVVSGLHVNLFMLIVYFIVGFFTTDFRFRYSMSMIILTFYCLTIGYSFPALRAMLMMNLILLFKILDYPQDEFNVLGFSGVLIFLFDPLSVLSVSFQMSFVSTFIFMKAFSRKSKGFFDSLKTVLVLTASLTPFTVLYFGRIYPLSVILSSLLVPITIIPMILGGTMGFLAYFTNFGLLSKIFIKGVEPFVSFIRFFTDMLLKIPLTNFMVAENWRIPLFYLTFSLAIVLLSSPRCIFFKQSGQIP